MKTKILCTKPNISLHQVKTKYATDETCKTYLKALRWPNGVKCPRCGNEKVYELKARPFHWLCKATDCGGKNGYRFSVISGTVFENTNYPLKTWFEVIYLMTQSKKGISALQIHRQIGTGDYRTAWYMCHRIRAAMQDKDITKLLGEVEVDETYMGGKEGNKHVSKRGNLRGVCSRSEACHFHRGPTAHVRLLWRGNPVPSGGQSQAKAKGSESEGESEESEGVKSEGVKSLLLACPDESLS